MSTLHGSCLCGQITYQLLEIQDGAASKTALCHCLPCRKISGSTFSVNLEVPSSAFRLLSGQLKQFQTKHPEAGFTYSLSFCPDCGTPIYAQVHTAADVPAAASSVVLQVGTLDDPRLLEATPAAEMNIRHRVGWSAAVGSAKQMRTYTE